MSAELPSPHGGLLVDLMAAPARAAELKRKARVWPSWDLTPRQQCDLELLLNGAFSPLAGFMNRRDYESVCERMRLGSELLWPIPVTLDVTPEVAAQLKPQDALALRDPEGVMLAALTVEEVWELDRKGSAERVYGTLDRRHPGVAHILERKNGWAVAGRLEGVEAPVHYDSTALRLTPAALRADFLRRGWTRVVAFQTRNPMHRAHQELTLRAMRTEEAALLIHPVVGMTKPGDVDHYTRVRCYRALLPHYPEGRATLALLPLSMRMAGPREALWHAIIRKNFGCSHFIVGRDHAGPGAGFYPPYGAQELVRLHEQELGMSMVPFREMVYSAERAAYVPEDEVRPGETTLSISGTEQRRRLETGVEIPSWFTFPEIEQELRRTYPPLSERGFTVFFTGLSGAGKSTIANVLQVRLLEAGGRPVTLLDGDIVRKHLSSELGFSREHRELNIHRIGFVAAEITKNGGIAICAPIAPYEASRKEVREAISAAGGFVLVHVATSLAVCEERDRKGLYAKARAGLIPHFTGVSDPYEAPTDAELVLDAGALAPQEAAQRILDHLVKLGYLAPPPTSTETR